MFPIKKKILLDNYRKKINKKIKIFFQNLIYSWYSQKHKIPLLLHFCLFFVLLFSSVLLLLLLLMLFFFVAFVQKFLQLKFVFNQLKYATFMRSDIPQIAVATAATTATVTITVTVTVYCCVWCWRCYCCCCCCCCRCCCWCCCWFINMHRSAATVPTKTVEAIALWNNHLSLKIITEMFKIVYEFFSQHTNKLYWFHIVILSFNYKYVVKVGSKNFWTGNREQN